MWSTEDVLDHAQAFCTDEPPSEACIQLILNDSRLGEKMSVVKEASLQSVEPWEASLVKAMRTERLHSPARLLETPKPKSPGWRRRVRDERAEAAPGSRCSNDLSLQHFPGRDWCDCYAADMDNDAASQAADDHTTAATAGGELSLNDECWGILHFSDFDLDALSLH